MGRVCTLGGSVSLGVAVLMLVRVLLASALRGPTVVYSGAVIGVRRPRFRCKWCCNFALALV